MFTAAQFTIAKRWKQPKCPSIDEWTNKMLNIHTLERAKKSKALISTTWVNLENMMLRVRSQTPKATKCVIPCEMSRTGKSRDRLMVARGWEGGWGWGFSG